MALKDKHGGASWSDWKKELRNREEKALEEAKKQCEADILFWKVTQYLFFEQWNALKTYANEQGISIIGICQSMFL